MTVRLRYKFHATISSDQNELKDLGNASYEVVDDLHADGFSGKYTLLAGATNAQIPLMGVAAATFFAVRTAPKDSTMDCQPITLRRQTTSGEAIVVDPMGGKEGLFAMTTAGLNAIYATNSSAVDMELTLFVVGN
jgi:hypothetical protein